MKQNKVTAVTPDRPENIWAELQLDFNMKGQISVLQNGEKYLEGEIDGIRWSQASGYMLATAKLFRRALGVGEEDLLLRTRVVQETESRMRPLMVLVGYGPCPDPKALKTVMAEFIQQTAAQSTLKFNTSIEKPSKEISEFVQEEAAIYLAGNGGQPVKRQMLFVVDGQEVATISGTWKQGPKALTSEKKECTVVGLYEGRLYRSRVLYLIEEGTRARQYVIPYDAEKFEDFLRGLKENKNAVLKVVFLADADGQGKPIELKSIELVPVPEHLELT